MGSIVNGFSAPADPDLVGRLPRTPAMKKSAYLDQKFLPFGWIPFEPDEVDLLSL